MGYCTPKHYRIHITPDLVNFRFSGQMEIQMTAEAPITEVTLNCLDLAIWHCRVKLEAEFAACAFQVDPQAEELRISLPQAFAGDIRLEIDYEGHINDKMAGFYRSRYESDGRSAYIAVTQFEESEARRAFPCLDHPEKKATFDIEMTVDEQLTAISNTAIMEEKHVGGGKKRVRFHRTPKMSTYLLFFGVGKFDFVGDAVDYRMRAAALPGLTAYLQFGLDFGRKSLQFCEQYYGIPYPLAKLDLIAIPDFAFGAMENWGAITFRENLLLHYPEVTSKMGEARICEVIAHEIAHQWFGNLVTPSDWKYLWLNESFATYFGYGVVADYHPEWEIWSQFLSGMTNTALERDALYETCPIEIPGGEHVVINTSTAPIIYNKGASILRQIEGYVGPDKFREGLQQYLKTHAYGSASSHHFWEALEEASDKPVLAMMQGWVEHPGYPIVQVQEDGQSLILGQKRFTYLPEAPDSPPPVQPWLIPLSLALYDAQGNQTSQQTLLEHATMRLDIPPDVVAYKLNHEQRGFFRVSYGSTENLAALGGLVHNHTLAPEDRWGLQNDLFALVRKGDLAIGDYLDFLKHYEDETAFLPLTSMAGNLLKAFLVLDGDRQKRVRQVSQRLINRIISAIGEEPRAEEPHSTAVLRDQLIWHAALYGLEEITASAAAKFRARMQGESLHPDIMKSIMQVGAWTENDIAFEWLTQRFEVSESEHERLNILYAIGSFSRGRILASAREWILAKVPARNKFVPIVTMAANPRAMDEMWEWYVTHIKEVETLHPMLYERVIAGIVPLGGLNRVSEVRTFFNTYVAARPKLSDVVNMSLENLMINVRMRSAS